MIGIGVIGGGLPHQCQWGLELLVRMMSHMGVGVVECLLSAGIWFLCWNVDFLKAAMSLVRVFLFCQAIALLPDSFVLKMLLLEICSQKVFLCPKN